MKKPNFNEAKKLIGKKLYLICSNKQDDDYNEEKEDFFFVAIFYIGGVKSSYMNNEHSFEKFILCKDKELNDVWGDVQPCRIKDKFKKSHYYEFYFDKNEAKKSCIWENSGERRRDGEILRAKKILDKLNVDYEIKKL